MGIKALLTFLVLLFLVSDQSIHASDNDEKTMEVKQALHQYGRHEDVIHSLFDILVKLAAEEFKNPRSDTVKQMKKAFIREYESSTFHESLDILYQGMFGEPLLLPSIPGTIRKITYDEPHLTHDLMEGYLKTILKGVKVTLAYFHFKGDTLAFDDKEKKWNEKIQKLISHIHYLDKKVLIAYTELPFEEWLKRGTKSS